MNEQLSRQTNTSESLDNVHGEYVTHPRELTASSIGAEAVSIFISNLDATLNSQVVMSANSKKKTALEKLGQDRDGHTLAPIPQPTGDAARAHAVRQPRKIAPPGQRNPQKS